MVNALKRPQECFLGQVACFLSVLGQAVEQTVNLTRALALEWAADGIRVNAVAPSYVNTDITRAIFSDPDKLNTVMQHTPLGRLPTADDVAAAIVYLCSNAARCVTGTVLPIDSGFLAR